MPPWLVVGVASDAKVRTARCPQHGLSPLLAAAHTVTDRGGPDVDGSRTDSARAPLSAFGLLALALATVGLFGVVSYAVSQRTRELGIRMALGADAARVVRLLVAGGLRLVVIGGVLGLALAVVTARLLGGLLFQVDTLDPLTFVGVPLVLGVTALLAAYLPARRASRVNPVSALRTG